MSKIPRATAVIIFFNTLVFIVATAYFTNVHFRTYIATRNFKIVVDRLIVKTSNGSFISIETILILSNPSQQTMEILDILGAASLDGKLMFIQNLKDVRKPFRLSPMTNITLTLKEDVPRYAMNYIKSNKNKFWTVTIRAFLRVPLIHFYTWRRTWFMTPQIST